MPKPTLQELMDGATTNTPPAATATPPATGIESGDGSNKPTDLSNQQQQQNSNSQQQQQGQANGQQQQQNTPPAKTREEIEAENIAKGLNPDGTEKTAEQKQAEQDALKFQEEQQQADEAVWEAVDKLWGDPLEVNYKTEGGQDVDPNTPEGIFLREQAVATRAINQFEAMIEQESPRAYAYLLHNRAGGSDEDFFATKAVTLPSLEELQGSADLQAKFYTQRLLNKGLTAEQAKLIVDAAQKDKKLQDLAVAEYNLEDKAQKQEIDNLAKLNQQQQQQFQRSVTTLSKAIDEEMKTGMKIAIPEAKRAEFNAFVRSRIQHEDGVFLVAQPIDPKNLGILLDQLYFAFAKGNLNDLVQRAAATQNTVRLRSRMSGSNGKPVGNTTDAPPPKKKMTLGEL